MSTSDKKYTHKVCVRINEEQYEFLQFLRDMWGFDSISDVLREIIDNVRRNLMMNYPLFAVEFKKWKVQREEQRKDSVGV